MLFPARDELEQRMEGVLRVIYLIFTEGYANPERGGSSEALCNEAIRLARLLRDLLSDGEVIGLLALMLLQELAARGPARRRRRHVPAG